MIPDRLAGPGKAEMAVSVGQSAKSTREKVIEDEKSERERTRS